MRGEARDISPSNGTRVICYCDDCQAFAHFLGQANSVLDEHGGSDIYQTYPSRLRITQGIEQLRCVRLTEKGLCRWYAGCCNTPIANTMNSAKMPFAGVVHSIMDHEGNHISRGQALGPVRAKIYGKCAVGKPPSDVHVGTPVGLLFKIVGFLLSGWLKKANTPSPFFDSTTGKPIVEANILSKEERDRLRKFCGPTPTKK
jgi:hypothetical protein